VDFRTRLALRCNTGRLNGCESGFRREGTDIEAMSIVDLDQAGPLVCAVELIDVSLLPALQSDAVLASERGEAKGARQRHGEGRGMLECARRIKGPTRHRIQGKQKVPSQT